MKALAVSHKSHALARVSGLIATGLSERTACRASGVSRASYQRWLQRHSAGGPEALLDRYSNCGRRPKIELGLDEANELRRLCLIHGSQTLAIEQFLDAPEAAPSTRQFILDELNQATREKRYTRWPMSIRRATATTPEEQGLFRGEKTFESLSFSPRKGLFFVDQDGSRVPLEAHTCWVMDDYSTNQPYILENGRVCRQILAAMDVFSDAWLSCEMIGRERDAYRAEDILRFILRTIDGQGTMPLYLLLEKGRWDSTAVHGLDLGHRVYGVGAKYQERLWGGLDCLFPCIHGFSSRHKACLESSFNLLQSFLAHTGTDIGRTRGEFEKATKKCLAVQAGRMDALAAGFLPQDTASEAHWRACQSMNARGRHRAATGTVEVPQDLLQLFTTPRPLPPSERWRFLPVKRAGTVRGGFLEFGVEPYPKRFRFQVNGLVDHTREYPAGYRLLCAFDPAMPELGAYIANGDVTSLNRGNLPLEYPLLTAYPAEDVPQFDLRSIRNESRERSGKALANARARTNFKSINPHGRRGLAVTARHDGEGAAEIMRTGARSAGDGLASAACGLPETGRTELSRDIGLSEPAPASRRQVIPTLEELEASALDLLFT